MKTPKKRPDKPFAGPTGPVGVFYMGWPYFLQGSILGTVIGGVASTVVPALGLTPPPAKQPPAMSGMQFFLHLAYGWITALVFQLLTPKKKNLLGELIDSQVNYIL